ncbi:hypothetical protein [Bartonella florencae]|uniref:hypothetical protein n=1 Tax=Bartonella florencae TaxID=928210 RepID=UPI0002E6BA86|nr:hypothetical protein [Bartonella florencae]
MGAVVWCGGVSASGRGAIGAGRGSVCGGSVWRVWGPKYNGAGEVWGGGVRGASLL